MPNSSARDTTLIPRRTSSRGWRASNPPIALPCATSLRVIQEYADAVGLSILFGAHMTLVPRVIDLLAKQGIDDVAVTVGGTIPAEDIAAQNGSAWQRCSRQARAPSGSASSWAPWAARAGRQDRLATDERRTRSPTRYAAAPIRTSPPHTIAIPAHCVRLSRSLSRTVPIKTGTSAYGAEAVATSEV